MSFKNAIAKAETPAAFITAVTLVALVTAKGFLLAQEAVPTAPAAAIAGIAIAGIVAACVVVAAAIHAAAWLLDVLFP